MRTVEEVIKQYEHVCWYPSAGSDYRVLLFLSDWYYKKNAVPMDEGQALPDLFVMTDYMGFRIFDGEQSIFGEAYEHIKDGYCEPGACLVRVIYKNSATVIIVKRFEKLCDLSLNYDTRLECKEKPEVYNSAFLMDVEVISRLHDETNMYETSVLYIAAENQLFAEKVVIPNGIKMEYLVIVNYGNGFGGGNGIGWEWMFNGYKELGIKYVVSNHGVKSVLDERRKDNSFPELAIIHFNDGRQWTNGNNVTWYKVVEFGSERDKDRFSEEWDKKFGPPTGKENVSADDFMKLIKEMSTFCPPVPDDEG